jgi:hypothetical protein
MKLRHMVRPLCAIATLGMFTVGEDLAEAAPRRGKAASPPAVDTSNTGPRRESVALTVYNQNFALVKDVRVLDLENGHSEVKIDDVAASIDPTSVHFAALDHPNAVAVVEQNYQYDLANADRILTRYLDHPVTAILKDGGKREGTLLSYGRGDLVLQAGTSASILNRAEFRDISLGEVPGGLVVKPALFWTLESERQGPERMEVSYLTDNITWHAEYVAVVNAKDDGLTLNGWVSLDNRSGAGYENAKLKLVAGDVHRILPANSYLDAVALQAGVVQQADQRRFEERNFFEYHIYTLDRPATVADKETKQLALFPSASAGAKKTYTYDGYRDAMKVAIRLEFENSKENRLGLALPAGKVRVYKEDADQALEFVGEDQIDHTPRDETVRLFLGNAFDVVGKRTMTDIKQLSSRSRRESDAIEIRNHKDEAIEVNVIEHLQGDWKITDHSHDFVKKNATTVEFPVKVPPNGSVSVVYTAEVKY